MQARNSVSIDSVLKRLQQLRNEGSQAAVPTDTGASQTANRPGEFKLAEAASPARPPAPAVAAPAIGTTPQPGDANLESLWRNVIEAVGRVSPFTHSYLLEAHPVSFEKNIFTIGFDPEFADHLDLVNNAKNYALIQTKLQELGHAQA